MTSKETLSAVALPDELEVVAWRWPEPMAEGSKFHSVTNAEPPCSGWQGLVRADQAHSTIAALRVERDGATRSRDYTVQWYAERLRKIEDVAKREGLWPEVAAIIANGSGTRQLPDGSFVYDPPTYAQQLNSAKHRAETAEAEVKRLTEEKEALRAERKYLDQQAIDDQREHAKLHRASEARIKALEEALGPFAEEADHAELNAGHDGPVGQFVAYETLCEARAILNSREKEE